MKRIVVIALAAFTVAGCLTSPYDQVENWLIREDAVRAFAIPADVIYVQNDLYVNMAHVPIMHNYAQTEVGNGRFHGLARVFAPLVATPEDLEGALDWYFWNHHERDRPFVFIGEGEGGALLKAYEKKHCKMLSRKGLVARFYTDAARKGFVTKEMVHEIRNAIERARYRRMWGHEMPEGMLNQ